MDQDLQKILKFTVELDRLKGVLRKTRPVGLDRYENSAEHSWQVCLLAVLLASHARHPVDVPRVIELLLVHDIPEIEAGDLIVYQAGTPERFAAEQEAARRIFGLLPEPQAQYCMARWLEFEARDTAEAIFAYAIDRLMPVLHNLQSGGQSWNENRVTLEKILSVNAAIGNAMPTVWEEVQAAILKLAATGAFTPQESPTPLLAAPPGDD